MWFLSFTGPVTKLVLFVAGLAVIMTYPGLLDLGA